MRFTPTGVVSRPRDYTATCFVIMPFGNKPVGRRKVNFDRIYDDIFVPAIEAVPLPEGGNLRPHRTDRSFFAGDIGQEMFEFLQYSRFALADITGLNANVMYEIGVRHAARASGTAIFRQTNAPIPFDINRIKAFPYDYRPATQAEQARQLIWRVLSESLVHNALDSPVQQALRTERKTPSIEPLLLDAENAIRRFDRPGAIALLRRALDVGGPNAHLHVRFGLLLRDQGELAEAVEHFKKATKIDPRYGEAWRELGVNQGRLTLGTARQGESAIRKAIALNPNDFDALSSLGGFLRRQNRLDEALRMYERAAQVSAGHPYPLLMMLKLRARLGGRLDIDERLDEQLRGAERMRQAQADARPPLDAPWCFFDMAEIHLYRGDADGFLRLVKEGLEHSSHSYERESFRSALQLLKDGGVQLPGLDEGLALLAPAAR